MHLRPMRLKWLTGLAACAAASACTPDQNGYYGTTQAPYSGYNQPGYATPGYTPPQYAQPEYAQPGYLVPDAGPSYVQPYGYPVPVGPGFGYRGDGDFRGREFRRELQDREFRERQFRGDPQRFNQERGDRERFERGRADQQRFRPEPPRAQPRPPPGQTPPLPGGLLPGVPRPQPHPQ